MMKTNKFANFGSRRKETVNLAKETYTNDCIYELELFKNKRAGPSTYFLTTLHAFKLFSRNNCSQAHYVNLY